MKTKVTTLFACLLLSWGVILLAEDSKNQSEGNDQSSTVKYIVDNVHSAVIFRVKHSGVSNFYGRFNKFSGYINYGGDNNNLNSIEIIIEAGSVDTANAKRDEHLKISGGTISREAIHCDSE